MDIDWNEQWASFSPYYREGSVCLPLQIFGGPDKTLQMEPGPGFGDLSHPTTRLCLKLLFEQHPKNKTVLDIGSGSGILALAAALGGAKKVWGVELEPEALLHCKKNKSLNGLGENIFFHSPPFTPSETVDLVLFNMISSEQKQAQINFPANSCTFIVSGIPKAEEEEYLSEVKKWGWELIVTAEEEGWLAFVFKS